MSRVFRYPVGIALDIELVRKAAAATGEGRGRRNSADAVLARAGVTIAKDSAEWTLYCAAVLAHNVVHGAPHPGRPDPSQGGRRRREIPARKRAAIIRAFQADEPIERLMRRLHVGHATVTRVLKEAGIPRQRDIKARRAICNS